MANVTLTWPANPAAEQVIDYHVWESTDGGVGWSLRGVVTDPTLVIPNIPTGQYSWKVQARNLAGFGVFSNVANSPGVPSQVGDITVEVE